jgi:hypothetical protein
VFPQPFEVELVGRNFWEGFLPLAGPFAIASGALLGVWFSNRNAGKRHEEQLSHDRDLHEQRLTLDRQLHADQLANDRAVRAREETRAVIDEVTSSLTDAMDALANFVANRNNLERTAREQAESESLEEREHRQEAWNEDLNSLTDALGSAFRSMETLRPSQLRLRLRFPEEHPIYRGFVLVCSAVERAVTLVANDGTEIRTEEVLAEEEESRVEVARRLGEYVRAVRSWGEELPLTPDQDLASSESHNDSEDEARLA